MTLSHESNLLSKSHKFGGSLRLAPLWWTMYSSYSEVKRINQRVKSTWKDILDVTQKDIHTPRHPLHTILFSFGWILLTSLRPNHILGMRKRKKYEWHIVFLIPFGKRRERQCLGGPHKLKLVMFKDLCQTLSGAELVRNRRYLLNFCHDYVPFRKKEVEIGEHII